MNEERSYHQFNARRSVDELLQVAVQYSRGRLTLSEGAYKTLMASLESYAMSLHPGDTIRLDGVTLSRNRDGSTSVEIKTR